MRLPEAAYFSALSTRFEKTWWMASESAPTRAGAVSSTFNSTFWARASSRKLCTASCRRSAGATDWISKRCSPDSTLARVSRSSVRRDMRRALLRMMSRNSRVWLFSVRAVEQGFGIALNRSQRSAQLVRNIGDKIAPCLFHPLGLGQIAQHRHRAAAGHGRGGHVEGASRNNGCGPRGKYLSIFTRPAHSGQEIGIANGLHQQRILTGSLRNQFVHGLVRPLHAVVGTDRDDGVLHAVEQGFQLALAGLQRGETFLQMAGGLDREKPPPVRFHPPNFHRDARPNLRPRRDRQTERCAANAERSNTQPWRRMTSAKTKATRRPGQTCL